MSRSYKKTPVYGHTGCKSDKKYKKQEHKAERTTIKKLLIAHEFDKVDSKHGKEYGNPWSSGKDGKCYWIKPSHEKFPGSFLYWPLEDRIRNWLKSCFRK